MANKFAHYRGQRFKVVNENDKFVTLEGYGYRKRHLKDEVIFEEQPEDTLLPGLDDTSELHAPQSGVQDLPKERKDLELVQTEQQKPVFDRSDLDDDLVDGDPAYNKSADVLTPKEKQHVSSAKTMALSVPQSDPVLQLAQEGGVALPVEPSPESVATEAPKGTTSYPNYPKIGIDTSILSADDRHSENEKRRKDALAVFKEKLHGMLQEIDEMEMTEAPVEGLDAPYETFEQFLEDFVNFAKDHDFVSADNKIDVPNAVVSFTADKHADGFIKQLGGVSKVTDVLTKKVTELGLEPAAAEAAMAESLPPVTAPAGSAMPANDGDAALQSKLGGPVAPPIIAEDGSAAPSAGGGVSGVGGVNVASTTGPGTTTANVANFNARLGIGTKKRPLNETEPTA